MVQPGLSERSESGPNMDVKNLIVLMSPSSRDRDFGGGGRCRAGAGCEMQATCELRAHDTCSLPGRKNF